MRSLHGSFLRELHSMAWFKGTHISWEILWFPVDFSLNQSIDSWNLLKKNAGFNQG